jgi:hypothetical protein
MTTTITGATGVNQITDDAITAAKLPAGSVIQVVQTVYRGITSQGNVTAQTTDSGGHGSAGLNWTDLDTTITPSSTSSKILVMINAQFSTLYTVYGVYRMQRGINGATPSLSASSGWMPPTSGSSANWLSGTMMASTSIGNAAGHGPNGLPPYAWQYLDSPSTTNAVKYRVNTYLKSDISGGGTIFLNRTHYSSNDYGTNRSVSTVTLMEIAG